MGECPPGFADLCVAGGLHCPLYVAGDCMHSLAKHHRGQEGFHRSLAQKYEAEIRRVVQDAVLKDAVKPEGP